jgi:hypothetical protein
VEHTEQEEADVRFQFESHFLSPSADSNSFIRSELVLDSSLRLATLFNSLTNFVEEIFDKSSAQIHDNNIRQKFYEMKVTDERQQVEQTLQRLTPTNSRPSSTKGQRNDQNNMETTKRQAEQLIVNNKLLKEAKVGVTFRKLVEYKKLIQIQAETYAFKMSGASAALVQFMQQRERKQRESVTSWELKRQALQREIVQNTERILRSLNSIIYSPEYTVMAAESQIQEDKNIPSTKGKILKPSQQFTFPDNLGPRARTALGLQHPKRLASPILPQI